MVFLVACGSVPAPKTDGGNGDSVDADPAAPPTVVSTMPANAAAGVKPDAKIVVTFSKPMDQASVLAAWTSADLPTSQAQFAWNSAGDTLTVTPSQPLPVATGSGLDPTTVTALEITYSIAASATDTTDKPLTASLAVKFTTVKRMTHDIANIDALTQSVANDGTVISPSSGGVGKSNFTNVFFRVFASFQLPTLVAGATVETAQLVGRQETVTGAPYTKLGNLKAQHVNFAQFDANTFAATPLGNPIGDFSTNATVEQKSLDVTAQVRDDYANSAARGGRSQYRLEYPLGTNNDGVRDIAFFTRTAFALRLTYTAN
ncbi:MAG TPA: Ig-like domain-containing protein [Kofleriaceae bacterium]